MEVGHIIANLRRNKKISQQKLAEDINVSRTVIGLWETNNRTPSFENICTLADYFCISADVLCENDRKLLPSEYCNNNIPQEAQKILNTFMKLNEDNRDILIGEAKKLLKSQKDEIEKKTDKPNLKKAT